MKCVLCGKEAESNLCPECYTARNDVVELADISITECPKCGNFKIAGRWKNISFEEVLEGELQRNIHIHPEFKVIEVVLSEKEAGMGLSYKVTLKGEFMGIQHLKEKEVKVNIVKESCTRCNMESGGYYEAIIQLRAKDRKIDADEIDIVTEMLKTEREIEEGNPKAFVSKVKELKEGVDYYIGSREMGRKVSRRIASELGANIKTTKKIAGRAEGRDLFRFTYLVRLPPFREGDIIVDADSHPHIPIIVTNQKLWKGIAFSGETVNLKNKKIVRIQKKDLIKETFVLNSDSSVAEILHPVTNKIVMVRNYWNLEQGEQVILIECNEEYFALPKKLMNI